MSKIKFRDSIFVWIIIVMVAAMFPIQMLLDQDVLILPFAGAITCLFGFVFGYLGLKQAGQITVNIKQPQGRGTNVTKNRVRLMLAAVMCINIEALIYQAIYGDTIQLPLNEMFVALGVIGGVLFAGNQAVKTSVEYEAKK
jgi:hypothetical protein